MKKISIRIALCIVLALAIWEAANYLFPITKDQNETIPFLIEASLNINENISMPDETICGNYQSCKIKGDKIADKLFSENSNSAGAGAYHILETFDALIDEEITENEENEETENFSDITENKSDFAANWTEEAWNITEKAIATYTIENTTLTLENKNSNYSLEDAAFAEEIWDIFTQLIPAKRRKQLKKLEVHKEWSTEAYIGTYENSTNLFWKRIRPEIYGVLGIDLQAFEENEFWFLTFFHEFSHLFSLNDSEYGNIIFCKADFTYDCFTPWSYLQHFFDQFRKNVDKDWIEKDNYSTEEKKQFYLLNQFNFLNSYASGNPHEDFAESFAAFIIRPSRELDSQNPIDQKQLFFYQYPELVALRRQLLNNIEKLL